MSEKQSLIQKDETMPKSRAKALARIEKTHGKEAADARALIYEFGKACMDAGKQRIERFGTSAPAGVYYCNLWKEIQSCCEIESVKTCDVSKYPLLQMVLQLYTKAISNAKDKNDEKKRRTIAKTAAAEIMSVLKGAQL